MSKHETDMSLDIAKEYITSALLASEMNADARENLAIAQEWIEVARKEIAGLVQEREALRQFKKAALNRMDAEQERR